jgi:hypothetical protein
MPPQIGDPAHPAALPARRRIRFSLRGLILVTALLCAIVSHVLTSVELHQVRREASRLRDELGYLTIGDKDKLHAIALASEEGHTARRWRWRLYFPAGRAFRVCYKFSDLPAEGIPNDNYEFFTGAPGELTFSASVVREPAGDWRLVLGAKSDDDPFRQVRTQVIPEAPWLTDSGAMSWSQAGESTTESVGAGEPLVLLRLRQTRQVTTPGGATGSAVDPKATDGVMIWIEEANQP